MFEPGCLVFRLDVYIYICIIPAHTVYDNTFQETDFALNLFLFFSKVTFLAFYHPNLLLQVFFSAQFSTRGTSTACRTGVVGGRCSGDLHSKSKLRRWVSSTNLFGKNAGFTSG